MSDEVLLRVDGLEMHFPVTAGVFGREVGRVKAVDGVSFELRRGRTLGLVGESGCGKTTIGKSIVRLLQPTGGRIVFENHDLTHARQSELRDLRRELQIIFQDPFGSLNPRMTVADIVGEAFEVHGIARGAEADRRVTDVLGRVGVPAAWINRYPHEFSGGQRQRISIARAIALEPKLVVCDEAVSALDVSIQAQVINLLIDLQREMQLAYLFISHDLSVVRHISDDVAVMYLGQIVESATASELFARPAHPYARALLSAIPVPDPTRRSRRTMLQGDVPTPLDPPSGCRFHTRCPALLDRCRSEEPPALGVGEGHRVKCWHAEGLADDPDWFRVVEERIERAMADAAPPSSPESPVSRFALASPGGLDEPAPMAAPVGAAATDVGTPLSRASRRAPGPRLAAGAMGLGALLVLLGSTLLGAGIAVGGLLGWHRLALPGLARSRRVAGLLAALAVCWGLSWGLAALGRQSAAEAQLEQLETALAARGAIAGAPAVRLADLGWRLPAIFPEAMASSALLDPWGGRWHYRVPGAIGRAFDLGSAGRDGRVGTADDLGNPFEP